MRARALAVALFVLAGSLAAQAGALEPRFSQALRLVPLDTAPPPLALKRLDDGRTVTLADLHGRPVLLYFWATW